LVKLLIAVVFSVLLLVPGILSQDAFAVAPTGDGIYDHPLVYAGVFVPSPVNCNVDSNVVAWVTNNGGTVGFYQNIASDIQNNLGVTARDVNLGNFVPSCIEKLVITHANSGNCLGSIGAVAEAAVLDWVTNQGGELLILEEHTICGGGSSALTAAFGATHQGNAATSGGFPGENYDNTEFVFHPIMDGVTSYNMIAGTDFATDGTLASVVIDSTNNLPVMLAGPFNDGCVVITGDATWPSDVGPGGAININDNRLVANNVFNFLNNICNPPVGGELLPINTTALLLAGAQTFSWMIPVVLSVLGIGLFVVSRKS